MAKKASLAIVETITRARELMRKSQHMINLINKRDNFRDLITISCKKRDHPSYITMDVWIVLNLSASSRETPSTSTMRKT